MAKDFDIFLHRHLTECDLIIQSLPFRDGISVTDRIIIDAVLQGCRLLRITAAQSDMEIAAKIDKIIKTCHEKLGMSTVMNATADFKARVILPLSSESIEIVAENLGTLSTLLSRAETGMTLSADILTTRIAKSLGHMDGRIELNADITDTLKRSILTIHSDSTMNAEVLGDKKTGYLLGANTKLSMDATLASLCKRIGFNAVTGIEVNAMVLGTRLSHSLGRAISGITINSNVTGTKAKKFEAVTGTIQLAVDATPVLIKLIYPENSELIADAGVSGSTLKRYRLLGEMDDLTLQKFDNMTFDEADYVILAE